MTFSKEDLRGRLPALDATVAAARDAVAAAENEVVRAQQELSRAEQLRDGAAAFIELLDDDDDDGASERGRAQVQPAERSTGVNVPSRTGLVVGNKELVASILAEYHEGVLLRDLQAEVRARGIDLNDDQVRSAVTYLGRTGRASNLRRGWWIASEKLRGSNPATDELLDLVGTSADPAEAGSAAQTPLSSTATTEHGGRA